MGKFNANNKVIKKGTITPIMTVEGNAVKPGFPEYERLDDIYICSWDNSTGKQRSEFHEEDLELYQQ